MRRMQNEAHTSASMEMGSLDIFEEVMRATMRRSGGKQSVLVGKRKPPHESSRISDDSR
jgi:hypothetical protein